MALKDEVMDLVLLAIQLNYQCLSTFSHIAENRPVFCRTSLPQFKTEKWLQAEIAFLLHQRYFVGTEIPCGEGYTCDLAVRSTKEAKESIYIAMKCYSASAQNPGHDADGLLKDIIWACADGHADRLALVVLPVQKKDYTERLLGEVEVKCPRQCSYSCKLCNSVLVGWWTRLA